MLWSGGIDSPAQLEQTGGVPLRRVGHNLVEQGLKTLGLRVTSEYAMYTSVFGST